MSSTTTRRSTRPSNKSQSPEAFSTRHSSTSTQGSTTSSFSFDEMCASLQSFANTDWSKEMEQVEIQKPSESEQVIKRPQPINPRNIHRKNRSKNSEKKPRHQDSEDIAKKFSTGRLAGRVSFQR